MTGRKDVFQNAMNQGHSAAWDQMWEQAAGYYRQAMEEFPDHAGALTSLGMALFEMRDYEQALKNYLTAAKITPEDPMPVEKVARIFERLGRLNEAVQSLVKAADLYIKNKDVEKSIDCWFRVISLQPESLMPRTRLAMIYERMGQKSKAADEYLATASLMQHSGDMAKAMQVAEYAVQIDPGNIEAQKALTMLKNNQPLPKPRRPHGGTGPVRMAEIKKMQTPQDMKVEAQDPITEARQKALVRLASLLFDQAELNKPSDTVSKRGITALTRGTGGLSLKTSDDPRVMLHLGQAIDSLTQGDDPQACKELESAVEIGLEHPAAYFMIGMICFEKDFQKGLRFLKKALKHPDLNLASYLLIAQIEETREDYKEAATAYLQALSLADSIIVPFNQAEEIRQLYEPIIETQSHQTNQELQKKVCDNIAGQLLRNDWRPYLKVARQQMPTQPEGTPPIPLAEMLLETGSSKVVEALARVRQLTNQKMYYSAMEEAFHALQYAPTYLPLHIQIGELLLQDGQATNAVNKFLMVANLYALRGEITQAVRLLKRVTKMAPLDIKIRLRLVDLLTSQAQFKEAIEEYIKAADIYYQLSELEKARETYSAALRLSQQAGAERSGSIDILEKIADIDMQRLDLRQAARVYEQIRTLEPEDPGARMHLIDLNFRLGQDSIAISEVDSFVQLLENAGKRAQAGTFLKEIIKEMPEKLELRKRLADLFVRDGKVAEAVEQLDHIADSLINAGNQRGAILMIKAIIALNPPNVTDYQKALKSYQGA